VIGEFKMNLTNETTQPMNTMHTMLKTAVPVLLAICLGSAGAAAPAPLEQEFMTPPESARMWTWWFWLGDKVEEKSITADLEALEQARWDYFHDANAAVLWVAIPANGRKAHQIEATR
jgi:hypothetical protein